MRPYLITPLSGSFSISGKFDLVVKNPEGYLEIIDFKTGKKNDNYFQLKFYKLLAEIKFKKQVSKASFYFLGSGDIEKFDLDKQGRGEIKDEVIEKINQILLAKEFEPRPSRLCKFCLFKTFCPEKEKVNEIVKDVRKEDYTDDLPF